mmetsp:Transcript_78646/g.163503  ORF Transcript_78646/g.163503 Transcript_78646/m.163503 type:complete len:366 (-) Transcript_78646:238-1335(-)|eukprot:CAMPEP_0206472608 /NCGR_PEP_ID=MMETSP0324_2-20121206/32314_1 /ASSEMBLY_ACC=CAM_ASM_000836 /TAXON_ID=2866 /ORGANISM="Crypthecodinium cohnii, Strain Seligo" /LENGTH=365 /DNA_ID=CAMNT_0053947265 /DNA_START=109 /DNA_END=1206 /DNA_ORIENTATION=-
MQSLASFFGGSASRVPLNARIGDESFERLKGRCPSIFFDSEEDRIQTHLDYVADLLQEAKVADDDLSCLRRRQACLAALRTYSSGRVFPKNEETLDRCPVFIDAHGTHCAVGHMIAASGHSQLSEAIDRSFHLSYVEEIAGLAGTQMTEEQATASKDVLEWAQHHGFSVEELAMVQPGYTQQAQCMLGPVYITAPTVSTIAAALWLVMFVHSVSTTDDLNPVLQAVMHGGLIFPVNGVLLAILLFADAVRSCRGILEGIAKFTMVGIMGVNAASCILVFSVGLWLAFSSTTPAALAYAMVGALAVMFLFPTIWLAIVPCMSNKSMVRASSRRVSSSSEGGHSSTSAGSEGSSPNSSASDDNDPSP